MRYQGTIISWKEDRGFGFIRPLNGEPDVFAHISAFCDRSRAPTQNDKVIYELSLSNKGKYEAKNITYWAGYTTEAKHPAKPPKLETVNTPVLAAPAPSARTTQKLHHKPTAQSFHNKPRRGKDPFFATAMALMIFITLESVFFTFLLLNIGAKVIPGFILITYLVMSFLTYQAYVQDKKAARTNRWRTEEKTLHTMSLLCGWPGALLAQYIERHKVVKIEFQLVFWLTVIGNCLGLFFIFPKSLSHIAQLAGRVL